MNRTAFLPVTLDDMGRRGWDECDFVVVSGDAYVDHPSFAAAILGRLLEAEGYRVGIVAQPRWKGAESARDLLACGTPRLAWLVSAGAMDSMVAHYTANNKPRSDDAYSPGGVKGKRPDRAIIAYVGAIRALGTGKPVVIAASRPRSEGSRTMTTGPTPSAARSCSTRRRISSSTHGRAPARRACLPPRARGTAYRNSRDGWRCGKAEDLPTGAIELPSFEEMKADPESYCAHYRLQEENSDPANASKLIERTESRYVVQETPAEPLDETAFDRVMELPFARAWHPDYDARGGIPALAEVQFSLTSARGCFGACSFCAITFHQGRRIQRRSHDSLVREARALTEDPSFKGYIHDVGGPTANFRIPSCPAQETRGSCKDRQCLGASPCPALRPDHSDYLALLRKIKAVPGVKKVFIRSGIRFDYLMLDPNREEFLRELCRDHVSGQLKVAPEHASNRVLSLMRKSNRETYNQFEREYGKMNGSLGKKQFLVPYYIAAHPGATLEDALENALELRKAGFVPDQVQDFYPTPGTLATCMYHTGLDPWTGEAIHVARGARERALQRALLQFNKKENHPLVLEALRMVNRPELAPVLLGPKRRAASPDNDAAGRKSN
jgi:radical SAM superfamily enzyme YgiQ (UPF0313 family)